MFRDRLSLKSYATYILMAAVALACGVLSVAGQKRQKQPPKYLLAPDSVIRLRMNDKLTSKTARVGSTFTSTVVTPVYVRGVEVIPAGAIVTGHVTHVERASRKSQAGSINVTFTSVQIPNGRTYPLDASLAASDSADNEGEVQGKSSKKRNARFIGRGVVVGGIFNGAAGAATGGIIGAARGMIKKGEEAEINPGTEFDIILNRSVSMYAFR
ncbi:MAG TPA: hypothetical protein VIW80_14125 [Pyrinomonadaceae bacterium]